MTQTVGLIESLQKRGLIAQTTDAKALDELLSKEKITLYCGFDPTADSLHLGHLVPVLVLKRFQMLGHTPIALVGGATGMIGDPSFKATERSLNTPDVVAGWVEKIRNQLKPFLSFKGENAAIMENNYNWFGEMPVLTFLRDIGKHFSVNAMINKESVKQRINRDEVGISFTEFSYSLLQGYDYSQLNQKYNCTLQIGGSDQWGNITAGIDLTRRLNQKTVYGLTLPLITKSDGTKFGKSEGNAVWLDPTKTSPYQFYQFWMNTTDADVYNFMGYFTFLEDEKIAEIKASDEASGKAPEAQRILAEEVTRLVHGEEALAAAQRISRNLFAEDQSELTESDFAQLAQDGLPTLSVKDDLLLVDALVQSQLAQSKTQAREFIKNGAAVVNGQKIQSLEAMITDADKRFGRYTLLRRGKKNHILLVWEK